MKMFAIWTLVGLVVAVVGTNTNTVIFREQCTADRDTMECIGLTPPITVPLNITKVYLKGLDVLSNINGSNFADKTWKHVRELHISDDNIRFILYGHIEDFYFNNLKGLDILKIYSKHIFGLRSNSLSGLLKLRELHFNGMDNMELKDINEALENGTITPNLEKLIIDNIAKGNYPPQQVDPTFFSIAHDKQKLQTIELNDLIIGNIQLPEPELLCRIRSFSLSGSIITAFENEYMNISEPCINLSYLDISGIQIPNIKKALDDCNSSLDFIYYLVKNDPNQILTYGFLMRSKVIICNFVLSNLKMPLRAEKGFVAPCNKRKIEAKGNKLQFLNLTINSIGAVYLEDLDLSFNGMQYISPNIAEPADSIKRLILSNNCLNEMEKRYPDDYKVLFKKFLNLRELDLSYNALEHIPFLMFSENSHITKLPLSYLQFLGINNNEIVTLDKDEMNNINDLVSFVSRKTGNKTVVDLRWNPFKCSCTNLPFISWIQKSRFLKQTNMSNEYTCVFDDTTLDMKTDAYSDVNGYCERQIRIRTVRNVTIPIGCVVLASIVVFFLTKKSRKKKQRRRNFLNEIRQDTFRLQFLVFISFSSENEDLVQTVICPELSQQLKMITQSEKEHICIGDKYFRPGHSLLEEIVTVIEESSVVIFVVSNEFVTKPYCQLEVQETIEQQKPIILIITEIIDQDKLSPILKRLFDRYTRFKCIRTENGYEVRPSWELLSASVINLASTHY